MAHHAPDKKNKKAPLRLELKTPPPEMGQAISNVFGKLLGRSAEVAPTTKTESPKPAVVQANVVPEATAVKQAEVIAVRDVKGETSIPNRILDGLTALLDPAANLVYLRLYRLSHGFHSETCTVGVGKLAASVNLGVRTAERAIARLEAVGLVKRLSANFGKGVKGNTYLVRLPAVLDDAAGKAQALDVQAPDVNEKLRQKTPAKSKDKGETNQAGDVRASLETEHLRFVRSLYEELTGNVWKPADNVAYEQIKQVSEVDIAEAMQQACERASSRPNTFKFFIREIQAVASPTREMREKKARQGREQEIEALVRVAREVVNRNVEHEHYTTTDFIEDVKRAAAWKNLRYTPELLDAALERFFKSRY